MSFTLTPAAERFIRRLMRFDGGPGSGFRLAVSAGGCSACRSSLAMAMKPCAGTPPGACRGAISCVCAPIRIARCASAWPAGSIPRISFR